MAILKSLKISLTVMVFILSLFGCVSPPKGEVFQGVRGPVSGYAVLYIYAPNTKILDLGQMSALIYLDGKIAVRIDENSFSRLEVAPGDYTMHSSTDDQVACGGRIFPGNRYPPIELSIFEGEIYYLRYSSHPVVYAASTCERHLLMIPASEGQVELGGLREIENF